MTRLKGSWHSLTQRASIGRLAFFLTVVYAGAMFWLAPHPPMADLPQHAGQITLWRDLLLGQSPWQSLVNINYFTPYLIGYGLALPLTFLMPVVTALKLLLMLAYYAFVFCCVLLRRRVNGDERLDWLFVPGFFGLAYALGLVTFLVAAPLGLFFVLLTDRYAERPANVRGILLCLAGLLLFFSHGLVFLFACGIGVSLLFVRRRPLTHMLTAVLPYAALGALSIIYALVSRDKEAAISPFVPKGIVWQWNSQRLTFLTHIFGGYDYVGAIFAGVTGILMLWAPRLLKSRLNWREPAAFVPMAAVLLVWLAVPSYALKTAFLFERFALFILPCYAFMFCRSPDPVDGHKRNGMEQRVMHVLLALLCWMFLAMQTERLIRFARESEDFDAVREVAVPGQRALAMVFEPGSAAAGNPTAYLHYPLWYQAENGGFVDFNFAWFPPQIVRFRTDLLPAIRPGWEFNKSFNWTTDQGWQYRYFFIRHATPLPAGLFENAYCKVSLLKSAGNWSVYETKRCE